AARRRRADVRQRPDRARRAGRAARGRSAGAAGRRGGRHGRHRPGGGLLAVADQRLARLGRARQGRRRAAARPAEERRQGAPPGDRAAAAGGAGFHDGGGARTVTPARCGEGTAVTAVATGRHRRGRARQARELWVLLLPALVPVLVFSVGPLLYGIGLAFTDAQGGRNRVTGFSGLDNFARLFTDSMFWQSMQVGLIWAVSVTVLQFLAGLGLALLLNERLALRGVARVLALVPWAMPPVVIGLMWRLVYHPDAGIVNSTLGTDINWLADFSWALPAVVLMGVWSGMPQTTVVLLAGLQNVPKELYEAGAIDGAGTWNRFRDITL